MFPSPTCVQSQCLLQITGESTSQEHDSMKSKIVTLNLSPSPRRKGKKQGGGRPRGSTNKGKCLVEDQDDPSYERHHHQHQEQLHQRLNLPILPPVMVVREQQQEQQQQQEPHDRKVTFANRVQVRKVAYARRHVGNPTDLWYQPQEFQIMRENAMDLMCRVAEGETGVGNRKFCTRGLEKWRQSLSSSSSSSSSPSIKDQRNDAIRLVLGLQQSQRERGIIDPETIAIYYESACINALEEARYLGKKDQEVIRPYVKSIPQSREGSPETMVR